HHLHLEQRHSLPAPSEAELRRPNPPGQLALLLRAQLSVAWEPESGPLEKQPVRPPRRRRSVLPEPMPVRSWGSPTPSSTRAAQDKAAPRRRPNATTSNNQKGDKRWQQTGRPIVPTLPRGRS